MSKAFDPWTSTVDEAVAASDSDIGPLTPIFQWQAAQDVMTFAPPAVASGFDVLHCVHLCALRGLVMPNWLVSEFVVRYRAVQQLRVDSWDAAFGSPYPKSKQLAAMRRRRLNRLRVANEVSDFVRRHPDLPLDPEWERIGKSTGEGRTRVQELYSEAVKMGMATHAAELRKSMGWPRLPANLRKVAGRQRKR